MADLAVTWIAPVVDSLPQLAWLNELGRIQKINRVTVKACTGNTLTLDDVATVLCEPCDVMIWSGHGVAGGLLLPDRSLVRTKWLAAQVSRGCHPRVVILAACGSQMRDENLKSLTETMCRAGINAIGFPTQADDSAAGRFTIEFVRALAVNTSVATAFDVAFESISDSVTAAGVFLTPGVRDLPFSLEQNQVHILERLTQIEALLASLTQTPPNIRMTNVTTPDDPEALGRTFGGIHRSGTGDRSTAWGRRRRERTDAKTG
jgi:hypothetical protein